MQKNLNIEKITFKLVQIKFLTMHISNQKCTFDIFTVGHLLNIVMDPNDFWHKIFILTYNMYFWLLLQIYPCYLFNVITYYVKSWTRIAEQASICVFIKHIHLFYSFK